MGKRPFRAVLRWLRNLFVVGVIVYAISRISFFAVRWYRSRGKQDTTDDRITAPIVPFYKRLEELLVTQGVQRRPSQTQQEFVDSIGAKCDFTGHLNIIADAFYRVRFGGQTLDKQEVESIQQMLDALESTMAKSVANT